jgi:hypothetical protein
MAPQPNLLQDALDFFDMIDDLAGHARKPGKVYVKQEPAVITHVEAAKKFGGVVIKENDPLSEKETTASLRYKSSSFLYSLSYKLLNIFRLACIIEII